MEMERFTQNLEQATARVREQTRRLCFNTIPDDSCYLIILNASFDGNALHKDETLFPDHNIPQRDKETPYTAVETVDRLWRNGSVPEWIDITPFEIMRHVCHYELRCCGRFTANDELLYHVEQGYPPFHCCGPILPSFEYALEQSGKFDLHHYRDKKKGRKQT